MPISDLSWLKAHLLRPLGRAMGSPRAEPDGDDARFEEAAALSEAGRTRWSELGRTGALPSQWLEAPPFLFSPNLGLFQMGASPPRVPTPPPSPGVAETVAAMGHAFDEVVALVTQLRGALVTWGVIREAPAKLFLCAPTGECTVPSNLQYRVEVFEELVAVSEGRFSSDWVPTLMKLDDEPALVEWGTERWRWPRVCAEAAVAVRETNRAFSRASREGRAVAQVRFEVEPGERALPDFPAVALRGRSFAELPNPLEPIEQLFALGLWPLEVDDGGNVLLAIPEA